VILIIANRFDLAARALVEDWQAHDVRLMTCEDLSVAGWRHYLGGSAGDGQAMIGGCSVAAAEVTGVLTRLTYIWEQELVHIVAEDRRYVAAEMSAFLMSWLSALDCPVLNRPVPGCLSGPCWRPEQWAAAAIRADMRVLPTYRRVHLEHGTSLEAAPFGPTAITVVGHRFFGDTDPALCAQARRLADIAQVDLVRIHFSGHEEGSYFAGADLFPPITTSDVRDAVFDYFREPNRWSMPRGPLPPSGLKTFVYSSA
jgi:hypothetical protein